MACLKSTTHHSRDCKEKIICKRCKKIHPTSLHKDLIIEGKRGDSSSVHDDKATGSDSVTAMNVVIPGQVRVLTPSVPVAVKRPNSTDVIYTYLGMDCFSTASYVDSELIKLLGIDGQKTTLKLTTMEGKAVPIDANINENLEIYSLDGLK